MDEDLQGKCEFLELALRSAEEREQAHQSEINSLRGRLSEMSVHHASVQEDSCDPLEQSMIEMKVKEVEDMKQEMEALQAMVVAQTAQLILKKEQLANVEELESQLQLQQQLKEEAEVRAEKAMLDREQALSELQELHHGRTHRESVSLSTKKSNISLATIGRSESSGLITLQYVSQIARLEQENRRLKAQLQSARASSTKQGQETQLVKELRANLAKACAEIARLTVQVDQAKQLGGSSQQSLSEQRRQLELMSMERERARAEAGELQEMLQVTDSRLQAALSVIKQIKEQACIKVSVHKETVHAREKEKGQFVPVNRTQEESCVTWFTDERTKQVKDGPWLASEDRLLLQAQLQHGDDWLEIAKILPGRTDEAIKARWKTLTSELRVNLPMDEHMSAADEHAHAPPSRSATAPMPGIQRNAIPRQPSDHVYESPHAARKSSLRQGHVVSNTSGDIMPVTAKYTPGELVSV